MSEQPNTPPPPDRSGVGTEQRHERTGNLHVLSVRDCVGTFVREDRRVLEAMDAAQDALASLIEAIEPRFCREHNPGRLIYIGAGTSGRLGVLDASEAPPTFQISPGRIVGIIAGGDAALRVSSEGKEDDPRGSEPELRALGLSDADTVLALAAGGTTPYPLGALVIAKALAPGCLTGLICCAPRAMPPACDHLVVLDTGAEVLTGSTRLKAGTATKLALNTISTTLMVRAGRVYQNLMVDLRASNDKLRDRAARTIGILTGLSRGECFALLDRAGGAVKTAVVMHRRGLDRSEAEVALAAVGGRLDRALGA